LAPASVGFVLTFALALLAPSAVRADSAEDAAGVIEFLTHVRNARGLVRCGLFERKGWLKSPIQPASAHISGNTALCVFRGVRGGVYGVSAFHDENRNGKLDTNLLGIPSEDYCASRDARGSFGPPSFDDARFSFRGGKLRLEARMK
jgi:uncharacterized protein (DUF2141 family)